MKTLATLLTAVFVLAVATCAQAALPTVGSVNETTVLNALLSGSGAGPGALATFTGGATGGFQVPTAQITTGKFLAVDRAELEVARIPSMRFLMPLGDKAEIGVGYEDVSGNVSLITGPDENYTIRTCNINAKYALPQWIAGTNLAVGANYNFFGLDDALGLDDVNALNVYLAATHPIGENATFSGNLTFTMLNSDMDIEKDNGFALGFGYERKFDNDVVAGIEAILNAGQLLLDDADGIYYANAYVNVPITDGLTGRVALSGIGEYTTATIGAAWELK